MGRSLYRRSFPGNNVFATPHQTITNPESVMRNFLFKLLAAATLWFSAAGVQAQMRCPDPIRLLATNVTASSANLTWLASAGAASYDVEVYEGRNPVPVFATNTAAVSVVVSNLTPNTAYSFRVRANCSAANQSNWSPQSPFLTSGNSNTCPAPMQAAAVNITGSSADLIWSPVPAAVSYDIEVQDGPGNPTPYSHTATVTAPPYALTGLVANSAYQFRVRANCANGPGAWTNWNPFRTAGGPPANCPAPAQAAAINISGNSADIVWAPLSILASFEIEVRNARSNSVMFFQSGTAAMPPFAVTGLQPNSEYEFRIRTICSNNSASAWTAWIPFRSAGANPNVCASPQQTAALNLTGSSADLIWSPVPAAVSYDIEIQNNANNPVPFSQSANVTAPPYAVTGLQAASMYDFRVRTVCANGQSHWTSWSTFRTTGQNVPCAPPIQLMAFNVTATSADLFWSRMPGAVSYDVEIQSGPNNPVPFNLALNDTFPPYALSGLQPVSGYEFRVRTNCANGSSVWSPWHRFHTRGVPAACPAPQQLGVRLAAPTGAMLVWAPVAGALGYEVEIQSLPGTSPRMVLTDTTNTNSYGVRGLSPASGYRFRVRSICSGNHSGWSVWHPFRTPGVVTPQPCPTPINLTVSRPGNSGAFLSWSAVAGAVAYEIEIVELRPGQPQRISAVVNTNGYQASGLSSQTAYRFRVRTNCGNNVRGQSAWSHWVGFATLSPAGSSDNKVVISGEGTGMTDLYEARLSVYPNPVNSRLTFVLQDIEDSRGALRLMDMAGRQVLPAQTIDIQSGAEHSLEVSALPNGIYLLQVQTPAGLMQQRVVIAH